MYSLSTSNLLKTLTTKTNLLKLSAVLIGALLVFSSCKKGDTGPAGATGPAGPAGPTGTTGSANVVYSAWFTPSAYVKDTVFDLYGFYYDKATTDITQAVLDSGVVLTYGKLDGYNTAIWPTTQVSALPIVVSYKFSVGGITYNDTWSALVTLGKLKIQFVDDQNYYGSISNAHQFRYIIIPGGAKSAVASVKPGIHTVDGKTLDAAAVRSVIQNYRQMSYEEVCERLGVPQ